MEPRHYSHLNKADNVGKANVPQGEEQIRVPQRKAYSRTESFGLLVVLGFGVAAFTPAPYRRHRL